MKTKNGFTLVELLVVISILGILATIGLVAFSSTQAKGRDTQRKSDLKQMTTALELYFSDNSSYPTASVNGQINGCPSTVPTPCAWGSGEFTDGKTIYFKVLPKDPSTNTSYFYRNTSPTKFQIFAHLENTQDPQIIITPYTCGTKPCNFAVTSPNTTPSE